MWGVGVGGSSGRRKPSWRERENNRTREMRRRAISAKIFQGLRALGNYNLPMHCDNNEVLKALCAEAGWVVEPDGTTYRKGSKPLPTEMCGTSADLASQIPWYQPSLSSSSYLHPLRVSNSAPVTPQVSSPMRRQQTLNLETLPKESMPNSSTIDLDKWMNIRAYVNLAGYGIPTSPTFNLVRPLGAVASDKGKSVELGIEDETSVVKPWEGKMIRNEGIEDLELSEDLELTLGSGKDRA